MKKLNKILLIDDDRINNFLNDQLLNELDITEKIDILIDGQQGLKYLINHCESTSGDCPALVIFDHHMPIMDGLEMIRALDTMGFLRESKTVFLLLGINSAEEDIKVFKTLGVQEFTTKPLSKESVMNAYNRYWSKNADNEH